MSIKLKKTIWATLNFPRRSHKPPLMLSWFISLQGPLTTLFRILFKTVGSLLSLKCIRNCWCSPLFYLCYLNVEVHTSDAQSLVEFKKMLMQSKKLTIDLKLMRNYNQHQQFWWQVWKNGQVKEYTKKTFAKHVFPKYSLLCRMR